MKYACLVYLADDKLHAVPDSDCMAFGQELRASGHYLGGEALRPVAVARTVRVRDNAVSLTDGPFAETKEQLVGFYLIDAKDEAEALGIAARIPPARTGSVEVRPVRELGT